MQLGGADLGLRREQPRHVVEAVPLVLRHPQPVLPCAPTPVSASTTTPRGRLVLRPRPSCQQQNTIRPRFVVKSRGVSSKCPQVVRFGLTAEGSGQGRGPSGQGRGPHSRGKHSHRRPTASEPRVPLGKLQPFKDHLERLYGRFPESRGHNLALTVLYVLYSLDSGKHCARTAPGARPLF